MSFVDVLKQEPDQKWLLVLANVDEIGRREGYRFSTRSPALYDNQKRWVYCHAKFYVDEECRESELYIISSDGTKVQVEGPFDDSSDQYWLSQLQNTENSLITQDFRHYRVHRDGANNPAGFGGREFRIWLDAETADRFEKLGLKVDSMRADGGRILTTRNLWAQAAIPKKHQHLFTPNCKIL